MRFLNTPKSTSNASIPTPVKLFPPNAHHDHVNTGSSYDTKSLTDQRSSANGNLSPDKHVEFDTPSTTNFKQPLAPIPKLPPQQAFMSQENPFDIQSDLVPYQEKEIEPVFKTPELDGFLLPPLLGDQITDSTLMHRHLPNLI